MADVERIPVRVYRGGEVIAAILHRDLKDPSNDVVEYPEQDKQDSSLPLESGTVQAAAKTDSA